VVAQQVYQVRLEDLDHTALYLVHVFLVVANELLEVAECLVDEAVAFVRAARDRVSFA
jgi:hypothetical protein